MSEKYREKRILGKEPGKGEFREREEEKGKKRSKGEDTIMALTCLCASA